MCTRTGSPPTAATVARTTPPVLRDRPRDVERWRMQYALYKSDPDLQAAHARCPWLVTWDDHEVQNDYANTQSQYEGDITRPAHRRLPGLVRAPAGTGTGRDGDQPADLPPHTVGQPRPDRPGRRTSVPLRAAVWLGRGRRVRRRVRPRRSPCSASNRSVGSTTVWPSRRARWNFLASNVMLGRLDHDGAAGDLLWHDAWDGFPAARNRLTVGLGASPRAQPGRGDRRLALDVRQRHPP